MNRIFHARVPWYTILFLVLLTGVTVWGFWLRSVFPALVGLMALVVLVERIVHTTYTVSSDGMLVVYRGRFTRSVTIPLQQIERIEKLRSVNFGHFHLMEYLVIWYDGGRHLVLYPIKEVEFVDCIRKKKESGR